MRGRVILPNTDGNPISQDKTSPDNTVPIPSPNSEDIPTQPDATPQSQDNPSPVTTPTISPDPVPTPASSGYTVSFDSKGGSTVASVNVSSGGTVTMPDNSTKTGYVLAGWYKDVAFTTAFTFGSNGGKVTGYTLLPTIISF